MKNFWRIAGFLFLFFGGQFTLTAMAQRIDPCADVYNPHMRVDCAFARIATPSYGYRGRGSYGYGRYPNGYRQNYDGLTVCDFSECRGLVGTFHAHKGKELHFRPYDPSDRHMNVVGGGALGAGGGTVVGKIAGGNKGAAIGAVSGAVTVGLIANSKQHNNCLRIRSNAAGIATEGISVKQISHQSRQTSPAPVVQEVEGLEQKFVWNDTTTVNCGIFYKDHHGTQYMKLAPGQRVAIAILQGSDLGVMAEGILTPSGQRINKEIPYGKGKQYLPSNAGWRIFNVKLDQLDW